MTATHAGAGKVDAGRLAAPFLVGGGALAAGVLVSHPLGLRVTVAAAAAALLGALAFVAPRRVLAVLIIWLVAAGTVRRLLSQSAGPASFGDPVVLVGAATWVVLAAIAVTRGGLRQRTPLTAAVLVLGGVMVLSAVNPLQGGLTVGLGGLLLVVTPMLAFLVGRALVTDRAFHRLLVLVAVLAVVSGAYGLVQTFVGLPPWDERWVEQSGYVALNVGGTTRAFASFSAASEYAAFLGLGIVAVVTTLGRRVWRWPLAAPVAGFLSVALWFEAARGAVVLTALALALLAFAARGMSLVRCLAVGVAMLAALSWTVGRIAPSPAGAYAGAGLAAHQIQGLGDPFSSDSSLFGHLDLLLAGLSETIRNPLGTGVGAVSNAAGKYGGRPVGTEADPSNAAVAAGALGLLAYLAVAGLGVSRAHRRAVERPSPVSLAALGFLVVTLLQWLNGGQYAVAFVPWLVLGWLDRPTDETHGAARDDSLAAATR